MVKMANQIKLPMAIETDCRAANPVVPLARRRALAITCANQSHKKRNFPDSKTFVAKTFRLYIYKTRRFSNSRQMRIKGA